MAVDDRLCERSGVCEEDVAERPRFSAGSSGSVKSFSISWTSSKTVDTRRAVRRGELEFSSLAVVISFGLTRSFNLFFPSSLPCVCDLGNRGVGSSESEDC